MVTCKLSAVSERTFECTSETELHTTYVRNNTIASSITVCNAWVWTMRTKLERTKCSFLFWRSVADRYTHTHNIVLANSIVSGYWEICTNKPQVTGPLVRTLCLIQRIFCRSSRIYGANKPSARVVIQTSSTPGYKRPTFSSVILFCSGWCCTWCTRSVLMWVWFWSTLWSNLSCIYVPDIKYPFLHIYFY